MVHKTVVSNKEIQPSVNRLCSQEVLIETDFPEAYTETRTIKHQIPVAHIERKHINIDSSNLKPWQMSHARALEVHGLHVFGDPHQEVNHVSTHHQARSRDLPFCDL